MLVALPSAIAFGVLTYSALGADHAGEGALAGILGAAALGFVAALVGRTAGLISTPSAPAAAVLTALIASLLSGTGGAPLGPENIPALLALTALLSAALQVVYGAIRGGSLIKFIPYPVVSGYLSGVGVLIALGQLPKLLGLPNGTGLFKGLLSPGLWKWEGLVVGLVTMVLMVAAPRVIKKIPGPIIALFGGIATYFAFALFRPKLLLLEGNPHIIGPIHLSGSFLDAVTERVTAMAHVNAASLELVLMPALTLSVLLSIDTLKSSVGLDAVTRNRTNSDRALVGQGVGNFASFLVGGMPGSGAMGPSMVNVTSGGRTFRAGMFEGAFSILALLFLTRFIAWIPLAALAGILLVVAWRMFDKTMFHLLRHPSGRLDFGVIAAVVFVAATLDLMTAAGVGVALAILLFLRDQIHNSVIRRKLTLAQISSKTARLPEERAVLKRSGDMAVFCELQGNLFFGTTDQLYTHMEEDLKSRCCILFDLRRVLSLDFTAAHLFEQMHAQLAEHGGQLLFCGMPSGLVDQRNFQHYLVEVGVVSPGAGIMISDTMDGALEWMENRILESQGIRLNEEEVPLELQDFELFKGMDRALVEDIAGRMLSKSYGAGETVFSHGDRGDEIFFVRRGSVRILLPLEGGQHHHLATIEQGDFFGEMGFLDRGPRSAMAEAKEPTDLYVLFRGATEQEPQMDATFAFLFMARLAIVISHRLRETDAELRTLQER